MPRDARTEFVPRCACGAAIGWTRLIRRQPCPVCAIERARQRARREGRGV